MACKLKRMWANSCPVIGSILGWALSIFLGLSASMFAWLMPLLKIAPSTYLASCAVASIVLAVWIEISDRRE